MLQFLDFEVTDELAATWNLPPKGTVLKSIPNRSPVDGDWNHLLWVEERSSLAILRSMQNEILWINAVHCEKLQAISQLLSQAAVQAPHLIICCNINSICSFIAKLDTIPWRERFCGLKIATLHCYIYADSYVQYSRL